MHITSTKRKSVKLLNLEVMKTKYETLLYICAPALALIVDMWLFTLMNNVPAVKFLYGGLIADYSFGFHQQTETKRIACDKHNASNGFSLYCHYFMR